jgi:ribose/xylose/arabinose/galactoside ABC-type transport system permease subunit
MEIPRVGRKWSMVFAFAMMAVSMFLYIVVRSIPASVGFSACLRSLVCMAYIFHLDAMEYSRPSAFLHIS